MGIEAVNSLRPWNITDLTWLAAAETAMWYEWTYIRLCRWLLSIMNIMWRRRQHQLSYTHTHTHTHTLLTGLFLGQPTGVSWYQKHQTILDIYTARGDRWESGKNQNSIHTDELCRSNYHHQHTNMLTSTDWIFPSHHPPTSKHWRPHTVYYKHVQHC